MNSRRRRLLAVIAVGAAASLLVVGFFAGRWFKSPAQAALEVAPPPETELTAPIEYRVLQATIVTRGEVGASVELGFTPMSGGATAAQPVVTGVRVKPGEEIGAGQVVMEVSGRPVLTLPGVVPAYRDLRPGSRGKDVAQLNSALVGLGFGPTSAGELFGPETKSAVQRLYDSIGYPPATTGESDQLAVKAAEKNVTALEDALADLQVAEPGPDADGLQKKISRAKRDLSGARSELAELRAKSGAMLPLSEFLFVPNYPARVLAVPSLAGGPTEQGGGGEPGKAQTAGLRISAGELTVTAKINSSDGRRIGVDQPVEVFSEVLGKSFTGKVLSVGELTPDAGVPPYYPVVVRPDSPLESKLSGQNVRLTFTGAPTPAKVFVVPISALFSKADGSVNIVRRLPDGRRDTIAVTPGTNANGLVSVEALSAKLNEGDRVLISSANLSDTTGPPR
ncbi:hypothetical protein V5P93_000086 [Actinokineospora auranticolor]|uniref:peptidoglycan-binding protein n=1 Tax=Actinokineospora auranticolor TaxID=155976 RepID=UPI0011B07F1B|nr:peptidoglycan-binding protein [Actinokineospora auranticolor]